MICPNPNCGRIVSPFDDKCQHCGTPLETNPVKDYEKKADEIVRKGEVRTKEILESMQNKRNLNQNISESTKAQPSETGRPDYEFKDEGMLMDYKQCKIAVDLDYEPRLNWSLMNCGVPSIYTLEISNLSSVKLENIILRIKLSLGFSDSWETTVQEVSPKESVKINNIRIPIYKERIRSVKESEDCPLKLEILSEGNTVYQNSYNVKIEPYNQWFYLPDVPSLAASIAGFVLPNSKAVDDVLKNSGEFLQKIAGISSFHGYQGNSNDVVNMCNAIYLSFQWGLKIDYINPPASFDYPGQKILLPDDILYLKRGTCLDLSLFYAACIERIGLYPLLFLAPGHALLGVWLSDRDYDQFRDTKEDLTPSSYQEAIQEEKILPLNSTSCTRGDDFSTCIQEGKDYCKSLSAVVDIKAVRNYVKPMQVERR